jgi:L-fuculose-phosphate aldolase
LDYKQLIIDSGNEMMRRKLTVGTWGNISAKDEQGNMYLTPSGMDYDTCTKDDILVYDKDANLIEGTRRPTIEKGIHISVLQKRPDVGAVIHTHPIYSTIFSVLNCNIPAVTEEFAQLLGKEVLCAKYALPGTDEFAAAVVEALGEKRMAALCVSHGAVIVGKDMNHAFANSEVLEKACQVYYMAKQIGEPIIISDSDVELMQEFVTTKYGQY